MELLERIWNKVNVGPKDDCWEWLGKTTHDGYGVVTMGRKKSMVVHKAVWEALHGEVPEGLRVCHSCDNRRCCNPSHLFVGTSQDNTNDCMWKGRMASKVTWDQVREIRRARYYEGKTVTQIARDLGVVTSVSISNICNMRTFNYVYPLCNAPAEFCVVMGNFAIYCCGEHVAELEKMGKASFPITSSVWTCCYIKDEMPKIASGK